MRGTSRRAVFFCARVPKTNREAPIITGKSGGIGRRLISILLIVAVAVLVAPEFTRAEPAAITKAKNEAAALQERIDELNDQLEAAVEDYNYAKAKLSDTQAAAQKTQKTLKQTEKDLQSATDRLSARLVEIYKQGKLGMLDTLVGAASFSDLVNRFQLVERLSEQDSEVIDQVESYKGDVSGQKDQLAAQLEEEKVLIAEADAAKEKVEERLAANEQALKGKETEIAQLEKEEAARQARLAAAAKKAAEEAARKAKLAAQEKAKQAKAKSSSPSSGSVPSSAYSSDVVSIAMQYLGARYIWAGDDPSGFDCSGFVMYVFRKVGVSLPHSSRLQINHGTRVSKNALQPGDLVFFGNPIHHVGIYIGNGNMIHAAGTGKDVRIGSVWRSNYYGACRIGS